MLTPQEKQQLEEIKPGFNIIPEFNDYNYQASRRVDISRVWSKKLLRISFFLNLISVIFIFLAFMFSLLKPAPVYYASTPSGQIYGPLEKYDAKQVRAVINKQNQQQQVQQK